MYIVLLYLQICLLLRPCDSIFVGTIIFLTLSAVIIDGFRAVGDRPYILKRKTSLTKTVPVRWTVARRVGPRRHLNFLPSGENANRVLYRFLDAVPPKWVSFYPISACATGANHTSSACIPHPSALTGNHLPPGGRHVTKSPPVKTGGDVYFTWGSKLLRFKAGRKAR